MQKEIPADLQLDVLRRLPLSRCIVRFRRVSKSWRALLSEPSFLRQKLSWPETSSDSSSPPLTMMIENNNSLLNGIQRARSAYSLYSRHALIRLRREAADIPSNLHNYDIAGCCNGLLCFYERRSRPAGDAILWNPTTSETKVLPPTIFNRRHTSAWVNTVGFGFDPETNDYKVVRRINYFEDQASPMDCFFVELYSLTTDSWKEIHGGPFLPLVPPPEVARCFNGKLYWWSHPLRYVFELVSFDLSKEVFRGGQVGNPAELFEVRSLFVVPNQEEDSLVAIGSPRHNPSSLEVWALLRLWVTASWTKLYVFAPDYYEFYGISRDFVFYDRLMYSDASDCVMNEGKITACRLGTGEIIELGISTSVVHLIVNYVPSRVSLV